jgi:hypothetical protein
MTPEQLAEQIANLIAQSEERFSLAVVRIQGDLYRQLTGILKDLKLDPQGYILQTAENRAILRQAENVFSDVINNSVYKNAVEQTIGTIPDIDSLNERYFETVSKAFKPNRVYLRSLQQQIIGNVNTYLLQDGLMVNVKIPLNQILNQNINSGGSFSGMLDQLRSFITGSGQEGKLLRYSRTYLTDALFNYSRSYQQAVTADLGLEYYYYQGGLTGKGKGSGGSRPFCIERADKYYHQSEIEAWASEEWAGKREGTTESSIFIFAGGWNCRHSIVPVHVSIVPKEVIERQKPPAPIPT